MTKANSAVNKPNQPPVPPPRTNLPGVCPHPRVQIVSRDEDSEFVECLECREIFEASEFRDMAIEEKIEDTINGEA